VFIMFSFFRFIELYRVVYFSVSFGFVCYYVSQVIGWEDYTLVISFATKAFPCKDQTEELFIVMVHCMYSQHVTLSTLSFISLFKLQHADERHGIVYLL